MILLLFFGGGYVHTYNASTQVLPVTETDKFSNGPCRKDMSWRRVVTD